MEFVQVFLVKVEHADENKMFMWYTSNICVSTMPYCTFDGSGGADFPKLSVTFAFTRFAW